MKRLSRGVVMAGLCAMAFSYGINLVRGADEKPKYTIDQVMKEHKPRGLLKKVLGGKASDDEKKKMLEMYEAMAAHKAPKGDQAHWDKLNKALVTASKDVVDGKDGAIDALKKASDCNACHKAHKRSS